MKNSRKILVGLVAAAALAMAGASAYAFPGGGPGWGPRGGSGPWSGGYGPWGGGSRGTFGPGMMGNAPRGGFGPGMSYGPRGGFGPGFAGPRGAPAAQMDARLAAMKSELKITSGQESAWDAYAKQAKQQAESAQALFAKAQTAPQSASERISQRADFAKQRASSMEAMSGALNTFYAALTPEQKTVADRYFGGAQVSRFNPRGFGPGR